MSSIKKTFVIKEAAEQNFKEPEEALDASNKALGQAMIALDTAIKMVKKKSPELASLASAARDALQAAQGPMNQLRNKAGQLNPDFDPNHNNNYSKD